MTPRGAAPGRDRDAADIEFLPRARGLQAVSIVVLVLALGLAAADAILALDRPLLRRQAMVGVPGMALVALAQVVVLVTIRRRVRRSRAALARREQRGGGPTGPR